MEIAISILAVAAGIIGIIGCILPGLPGTPVSWTGMLILYLWGSGTDRMGNEMSLTTLLVWLGIVVAVSVVDYFIPMYFTRITGGSRYAERGAVAGLVIGIFFTPVGMILGSFLGAFLCELYYSRKGVLQALKAAFGSFAGFITGTGLKILVACLVMWKIIVYL